MWIPASARGRLEACEAWLEARHPNMSPRSRRQRAGVILSGWMRREHLEALTQAHTSFPTFQALLDARGYRPTIRSPRLADGYDAFQAARGRPGCFRG